MCVQAHKYNDSHGFANTPKSADYAVIESVRLLTLKAQSKSAKEEIKCIQKHADTIDERTLALSLSLFLSAFAHAISFSHLIDDD